MACQMPTLEAGVAVAQVWNDSISFSSPFCLVCFEPEKLIYSNTRHGTASLYINHFLRC